MHEPTAETQTTEIVARNIKALMERRRADEADLGWQERVADQITRFTGSMRFVWLHVLLYGTWIVINLGLIAGIAPFDPTFVILAMVASVEAIFLSTFILISQNRMQSQADRRADLNLQISLLAEHEITRLVTMLAEIGERLGAPSATSPDLTELKADIKPEAVLEEIEKEQQRDAR